MPEELSRGNASLWNVLRAMTREELSNLLIQTFKHHPDETSSSEELRTTVVRQFVDAGTRSLPWVRRVCYEDVIRLVATRLKLPAPSDSSIAEIERVVLFKVLEKSLDKMSEAERDRLAAHIENELRSRGIDKRVAFYEVLTFVKFAGVDVGGTVGGLALAGPGISGVIGLNFLQWIVLQGIILTTGHLAAAGAILGVGAGGALMTAAGAAGPVGIGAAILYSGYVLAGPAFRKLIPAVCVIAAKRLEQEVGKSH